MKNPIPHTEQSTSSRPTVPPMPWWALVLSLALAVLWGGNAVAARFAMDSLPPVAAAGVRFFLASLVMLAWCALEGHGWGLRRSQIAPVLVMGFFLFAQIALFNVGVLYSNTSHGVMLVNTAAFWVLAIEHWVTRTDRLTRPKVLGMGLAFIGTALILFTGQQAGNTAKPDDPSVVGDLVLLLSAAILGVRMVYTRYALKVVEPGKLILWHDVVGVAFFAGWSIATESTTLDRINLWAGWALLYQGVVVGGICFAIQAHLLKRYSASQIAVFGFATPLFGVTFAQVFRNDPLSPWLIVAAGCVAVGILLVNRVRRSAPRKEQPTEQGVRQRSA